MNDSTQKGTTTAIAAGIHSALNIEHLSILLGVLDAFSHFISIPIPDQSDSCYAHFTDEIMVCQIVKAEFKPQLTVDSKLGLWNHSPSIHLNLVNNPGLVLPPNVQRKIEIKVTKT